MGALKGQDHRRVRDVLTRRAEVHEPGARGVGGLHARRERGDQRNRDGSRDARLSSDSRRVDALGPRRGGNRLGGAAGNDAGLRLSPRERGFEVEHRLQDRLVREDLRQRVGRRQTVDQA